jgi:hypothetical protein
LFDIRLKLCDFSSREFTVRRIYPYPRAIRELRKGNDHS